MADERRRLTAQEATPIIGTAKPKPKPEAGQHPWWWYLTPAGVANEAKFRAKQVRKFNNGWAPAGRFGMMPIYRNASTGEIGGLGNTPAARQILHGAAVKMPSDAALAGINVLQRATNGWKPADPASTPVGKGIVELNRTLAKAMGAKLPEQMTPDEKGWFSDLPAASAAAAVTAPIAGAIVGPTAFSGLSPLAAQALRWTAGIGTESFLATLITDNRQGNVANLVSPNSPFAVGPKDDMTSAALKSLLPNAGAELTVGGIGLGISKLPNVARNLRAHRVVDEVSQARASTVAAGIQRETAPGEYEFVNPPAKANPDTAAAPTSAQPEAAPTQTPAQARDQLIGEQPAPEAAAIPSQPMEMGGAVKKAPLPEADPSQDFWYDPAMPEVDAVAMGVNRLDDQRLQELAGNEGPVMPEMERHLQEQSDISVVPGMNPEFMSIPAENLAEPLVPLRDQWQSAAVPNANLMSMAHPDNGPLLFDRVQQLTGRDFEQFTRQDVLDGIDSLRQEGIALLPNRAADGIDLRDPQSIQVAPEVFQFKSGTDAQGRQVGNSLTGVTKWNPDVEGAIQVWTNPTDGLTYVVNGHNRLAKAKELGLKSIRVEELPAATAEQARAMGAVSNIASGGGTAFDAAKFIAGSGIQDAAGLEKAGIPLSSGLGAQGLALSKLPGNLFQAAVDGELSMGRALALGGSGLDPQKMNRIVDLAKGRDITDRAFAELTQMASSAPTVKTNQKNLFGDEEVDTSVIKAELAGKIRAELIGNKNLFKRVGRNRNAQKLADKGGTQVNATQVMDAASTAQSVLGEFDATKYAAETPISQMLNEGAAEIANGAKPAVIAKRILQQLENAAEAMPPAPKAEPTPVEVAAPAEPPPLTAADRQQLRNKVIQQAVENGEVRPSATPIPDLPARPLVDPAVAINDAATNGIRPGSPAAQAVMDEIRLGTEHAQMDAQRQFAIERAQREAIGYDDLPLEQKKANGMVDGWEKPDAKLVESQAGIEIPPAAIRKLNPARESAYAESLFSWVNSGMPGESQAVKSVEQAIDLIRAKGSVLDPDAIPGLDMATARNDKSMGRNTPATQAVADAYRQFYGIDAPKPAKTPADTRGKGEFYHGAAGEFRLTEGGEYEGDGMNIYGDGLYATDDLKTASSYQKKNAKYAPKDANAVVYKITEKAPIKFYNLDKPAAKSVVKKLRLSAGSYAKEFIDQAVEEAGPGASLGNIFDEMRGWSREFDMPAYEVQEIWNGFIGELQKDGYGGFTHQGGNRAGNGKRLHQVRIYWDPANSVTIEKVPPYGAAADTGELASAQGRPIRRSRQGEAVFVKLGEEGITVNEMGDVAKKFLASTIRDIAGEHVAVKFEDNLLRPKSYDAAWGPRGANPIWGTYSYIKDVVTIYGLAEVNGLEALSTSFHEAFHRVQFGLMNTGEMRAMETAFGKSRINELSGLDPKSVATIERMAVAFQSYAEARAAGLDPIQANARFKVIEKLDQEFPRSKGSWADTLTEKVATNVFTAFEKVRSLIERFKNFAQGNGFTSVDDFFRKTYEGQIAREREFNSAIERLTPDQVQRYEFLEMWRTDNKAAQEWVQGQLQSIDAQIADLKTKALQGGC